MRHFSVLLLTTVTLIVTLAIADEFDDLDKKARKAAQANPFANRQARCVSRTGDLELTELWDFHGTGRHLRIVTDIKLSGSYKVMGKVLTVKGDDGNSFDYKYKLVPGGFQYIHEHKGKKMLFKCTWIK